MTQAAANPDFQRQIDGFREDYAAIAAQVARVIVGQGNVVDEILTCLLAGGHGLLEGVPGLGKTLMVRTLADALEASFSRIQFTPDLMPADITGTNVVVGDEAGGKSFRFEPGPIFANLILADEINRATPKTQSAVLEAMSERTVSVARRTHPLPEPFFVLATQNPLEMEGTYPLPEAQLDRFMFKIRVGFPDADQLVEILDRTTSADVPTADPAVPAARIVEMSDVARRVPAATHVRRFAADAALATHPDSQLAPESVRRYVRHGASPRAAQAMLLAAKVVAAREGRANAALDDVRAAAAPAMRHRLILSFEAQADGVRPEDLIADAVAAVTDSQQSR